MGNFCYQSQSDKLRWIWSNSERSETINEFWNVKHVHKSRDYSFSFRYVPNYFNCKLFSTLVHSRWLGWKFKHLKFEWLVWRKMGRVRDKRLSSQLRPSLSLLSSADWLCLVLTTASSRKMAANSRDSLTAYTNKLTGDFFTITGATQLSHLPLLSQHFISFKLLGTAAR